MRILLRWTTGLALGLAMVSASHAEEDVRFFQSSFAGTAAVNDAIDAAPFDPATLVPTPDGAFAFDVRATLRSNLGHGHLDAIVEDVFQGFSAECPGGLTIIDRVGGAGYGASTISFHNGRDQLELGILTREVCFDTSGGFTVEDTGIVFGGSGRFATVTGGFLESQATGRIRVSDFGVFPPLPRALSFSGTSRGTLQFANGD